MIPCRNAIAIVKEGEFDSVAFPLIGAGTGGVTPKAVLDLMTEELKRSDYTGRIVIVKFKKT